MRAFVLLLCLAGCSEPRPRDPFVGATIVTPDGRTGTIISNYAVGDAVGSTKWLVKFKEPNPKPGKLYSTEAFLAREFQVQW
jgi:hypothetical protein